MAKEGRTDRGQNPSRNVDLYYRSKEAAKYQITPRIKKIHQWPAQRLEKLFLQNSSKKNHAHDKPDDFLSESVLARKILEKIPSITATRMEPRARNRATWKELPKAE